MERWQRRNARSSTPQQREGCLIQGLTGNGPDQSTVHARHYVAHDIRERVEAARHHALGEALPSSPEMARTTAIASRDAIPAVRPLCRSTALQTTRGLPVFRQLPFREPWTTPREQFRMPYGRSTL